MSSADWNGINAQRPLRRCALVCPAHSMKMMQKAASSGADEVVLDLEDGCAPSEIPAARLTLVKALNAFDFGRTLRAFRTHPVGTPDFEEDIRVVVGGAGNRLEAMVVPKVTSPEEVVRADAALRKVEMTHGQLPGHLRLEVLLESAAGILAAAAIAQASPRVSTLIFGLLDYAADVGLRGADGVHAEAALLFPRSTLLLAARAAGCVALDSVTFQIRDADRLRKDAQTSAAMGFDGKWVVHPGQIEIVQQTFSPDEGEIRHALDVLSTYREAIETWGQGAAEINGEMVDAASRRVANRTLLRAVQTGQLDSGHPLVAWSLTQSSPG